MIFFRAATAGQEEPRFGQSVLLVQHILELIFGITLEPHELKSASIPFRPSDDRKGNDN
jgi:hypothetical protein